MQMHFLLPTTYSLLPGFLVHERNKREFPATLLQWVGSPCVRFMLIDRGEPLTVFGSYKSTLPEYY